MEKYITNLKVKIDESKSVTLALTDFNRLRWTVYAVETNPLLRTSLLKSSAMYITDSTSLMDKPAELPDSSHIVLWDGLNSYLELVERLPHISTRNDLIFVYVGSFKDLKAALPQGATTLFADSDSIQYLNLNVSSVFRLHRALRTKIRAYKNLFADTARHRQLSRHRSVVFCGLVRPSRDVLKDLLKGPHLLPLATTLEQLCDIDWRNSYEEVKRIVSEIFEQSRLAKSTDPVDLACLYSVLNICHRLLVLSYLSWLKCSLFVSEYGRQVHIDPYDTEAYQQNLFVDFGSTRGADVWYPRSIDMLNTKKQFISLRFLSEQQSLFDYLEATGAEEFISQCESEALQVLKTFKAGLG